jgi:hypothetical protein
MRDKDRFAVISVERESRNGNAKGKPAMQNDTKLGSCCKSMTGAMSFPGERHFFLEDGVFRLIVGRAKLTDGREAVAADNVYFCPFCGASLQSPDEVKARVKR